MEVERQRTTKTFGNMPCMCASVSLVVVHILGVFLESKSDAMTLEPIGIYQKSKFLSMTSLGPS